MGFSLPKNLFANASLITATGRVVALSSSVMGRPITILSAESLEESRRHAGPTG